MLPGAIGFVMPSKSKTKMMSSVDMIPKIDANESRESAKNAEGMSLSKNLMNEKSYREQ